MATHTYSSSVEIRTTSEAAWQALTDVEKWPTWTKSMKSVTLLNSRPFGLGCEALITQPGMKPAVWTVTDVQPGRSFAWGFTTAGVTMDADHIISASTTSGLIRVELICTLDGVLAGVLWGLMGKKIRKYVDMEANGLKVFLETPR